MKVGGARSEGGVVNGGAASMPYDTRGCTVMSIRVNLGSREVRSVKTLGRSGAAFRGASGRRLFVFLGSMSCVYKHGVIRRSTGCLFASGVYH